MAAVLWDRKGLLIMQFMQQGTTIMPDGYCETLRKLHRAIQNKKCGMLTSGVVLLQDKVHLHTTAHNRALLEQLGVV
jgi:hypothetical protein